MARSKSLALALTFGLLLAACQPGSPSPTIPASTTTALLTETPIPSATVTETRAPELTLTPEVIATIAETASAPDRPDEAILIQEPAPGSQVTSPIRVAGIADPTFEQTLVARVLLADGTEVTQIPTTIQSDVGQRGPFEVDITVDLAQTSNIFIQVYVSSARDGGITHLATTGVTFVPGGPANVSTQGPLPEQIAIFQPQSGGTVSGGVAVVEGFALASFEQTLVVDVLDADGNVVGSQPITVQAQDPGQPGPFRAMVPYSVTATGPGRIVVRDPSPAFGGDTHLNSVEVTLGP